MSTQPAPATDPEDEMTCRGCGCTDSQACPGGCWWWFDSGHTRGPLCSTCALAIQAVS